MKIEPEFPKAQNRYGWDYFDESPPKLMRSIKLSADLGTLTAWAVQEGWQINQIHPPEIISVAIVVELASAASMTKEFEQALREKVLEILKINPRPPYKPAVEAKEESEGIC